MEIIFTIFILAIVLFIPMSVYAEETTISVLGDQQVELNGQTKTYQIEINGRIFEGSKLTFHICSESSDMCKYFPSGVIELSRDEKIYPIELVFDESNFSIGKYQIYVQYDKINTTFLLSVNEPKKVVNENQISEYSVTSITTPKKSAIPVWIKNNGRWWSEGQIDDKTFVQGLQFLIKEKILNVPSTLLDESAKEIPSWIKTNVGWWASGNLDDDSFLKGIQFLIKKGIISVPHEIQNQCIGSARCFEGIVTHVIDGDTIKVGTQSIRFALVSAPELDAFGGLKAKEFVEKICPVDSIAVIDEDDKQTGGSYERIIGMIYCNGKNINAELVNSKLGSISTMFCSKSEFSNSDWVNGACEKNISKPTSTSSNQENCDPSYPTVCIPPFPPDLNCGDISYKKFKVLPPDPHKFDKDRDGMGCES